MPRQFDLFHTSTPTPPSASLWKSIVVKSIRRGWPTGTAETAKHLNRSTMHSLLLCGLFEDTFPAESELEACLLEVRAALDTRDFSALCRRETHHGRGLTSQFCALADEARQAAQHEKQRRMHTTPRTTRRALTPKPTKHSSSIRRRTAVLGGL